MHCLATENKEISNSTSSAFSISESAKLCNKPYLLSKQYSVPLLRSGPLLSKSPSCATDIYIEVRQANTYLDMKDSFSDDTYIIEMSLQKAKIPNSKILCRLHTLRSIFSVFLQRSTILNYQIRLKMMML